MFGYVTTNMEEMKDQKTIGSIMDFTVESARI